MKRALVTGANRGIGFAIASGLKAKGLDVVIGSRDLKAGQTAASRIHATAIQLNVADPSRIKSAVDEAGPIDVLVNNAGIFGSFNLLDDPEGFEALRLRCRRCPYLLMHHLTPRMVAKGYGRIVNVSSGWGAFSDGVNGPASYGVAKAALNALTVASARSLPNSVKVNAMCPGWVQTRMGGNSANRSPEEGADTAIWLAMLSDEGPTGQFFRNPKRIEW